MHDLPLILEPATDDDAEPIERLNERVFGPGRYARTAYRIRETTEPDPALSFVARVGTLLVGASAMTPIVDRRSLGPAARAPDRRAGVPQPGDRRSAGERARSRRRKPPAGSSSSWSAMSPITRGWDFSARPRAAYRCPARSIPNGSSIASSSPARWRRRRAPRAAPERQARHASQAPDDYRDGDRLQGLPNCALKRQSGGQPGELPSLD